MRHRSVVVLTGASGGIGTHIIDQITHETTHIVALCRSKPPNLRPSDLHIPCDLQESSSVKSAVERLCQRFEQIDVLIHCAGSISPASLLKANASSITREITLNLNAPILLTMHLMPLLQRGSHVIFVNSMAAVMPLAGSSVYAASKAGLRNFALSLGQEVKSSGIKVSSLFPGAVQTAMLRKEMDEGGSILNFVSQPLRPEKVASSVVELITHPREERFLPRLDGCFGRLCMFAPLLLRLTLPLLTFFGQRGFQRAKRPR